LLASQNCFHIHRSAKRCREILDELFGRDRRAPDQIIDQLMFSVGNAQAAPTLAVVTRCVSERPKLFHHRAFGIARCSDYRSRHHGSVPTVRVLFASQLLEQSLCRGESSVYGASGGQLPACSIPYPAS
jgi:hypothetical protein